MLRSSALLSLTAALLLPANPAHSQNQSRLDLSRALRADAIAFCVAPDQHGYTRSAGGRLTGKADLGFLARYIPASLSGAADFRATDHSGVIQSQLARAINDTNGCRLTAYRLFAQFVSDQTARAVKSGGRRPEPPRTSKKRLRSVDTPRARAPLARRESNNRPLTGKQGGIVVQTVGQTGGITAYSVGNVTQGQATEPKR